MFNKNPPGPPTIEDLNNPFIAPRVVVPTINGKLFLTKVCILLEIRPPFFTPFSSASPNKNLLNPFDLDNISTPIPTMAPLIGPPGRNKLPINPVPLSPNDVPAIAPTVPAVNVLGRCFLIEETMDSFVCFFISSFFFSSL